MSRTNRREAEGHPAFSQTIDSTSKLVETKMKITDVSHVKEEFWVGDWRLVGQGLHHTSFTTPYITHSTSTSFVCFFVFFVPFSCIHLDVVFLPT